MAARWHFREFKAGDNASDPDFTKALFSKGGEDVLATGLVREAIQNSLDARVLKTGTAEVRFTIRNGRQAATSSEGKPFFEGVWKHLGASNAGIAEPPTERSAIPFLTVEDFGTSGLTGQTEQWQPFGSEKNPFFLFFRALGRSGKQGEDRGRWGVGKFVFPLASKASCWFGYTVPTTTRVPSLMGRMVLKTHGTEKESFHPDGHWGLRSGNSGLVMPETDAHVISEFRALFNVKRASEPGLSVVVPWLSADITGKSLAMAVTTEYFMPILRGELVVTVDENGKEQRIDKDTIAGAIAQIEDEAARARVDLAAVIAEWRGQERTTLPHLARYDSLDWDDSWLPDDVGTGIRDRLERDEPVGIRIPIEVRKKGEDPKETFFDIFLRRTPSLSRQRPLIVREGITISEEKTSPLQGHASLLIVEDGPLAAFVGDAESPAHNELQYQLVKDRYTYAGKVLHLLRTCPASLIRSLESGAREDDPFLLAEFFPVENPEETRDRGARGKIAKKGKGPEPTPEIPKPRPARFRVLKLEGGFRVRGEPGAEIPSEIAIRFAYDVRRGNPLKQFKPFDFSLLDGDLNLEIHEAEVLDKAPNRILIKPLSEGFKCSVGGFDVNRNVIVKVDAT